MEAYKPWILFILAVLLDTLGTVLFKHGTNHLPESNKTGWQGHWENILGALGRIEISLGVIIYLVEYLIWMGFLSTTSLSTAYPMSSITIVLILVASSLFLGEKVGRYRWLGAGLIICGIFLVGGEV